MDTITLKNMAFYGNHGVLPSETELGQRFFVDLQLHTELTLAGVSDKLEDTINYAHIYEIVEEVVTKHTFKLLERLAQAIIDAINQHYKLKGIEITIRKPSVPIHGILDYASITLRRGDCP